METLQLFAHLRQDIAYGFRQLRQNPGFALAAVLSLALGIGANTAIFTLVNQILLRMLPVENPRELVQLRVDGGRFGGNSGDGIHTFAYPTYEALRDGNTVFTGLTGERVESAGMQAGNRSEVVNLAQVAGNFFQVFGIRAALGRLITPDDDRLLGAHPAAVLQYDFWRTRFNSDPGIVGETIRINGTPFTVLGVSAAGFEGTDPGFPNKVFVPITMRPLISQGDSRLDDQRQSWFYLFGRLKPGVTLDQAQASMRVLYRQRQQEELNHELFSKFPVMRDRFLRQTFLLEPAERGDSSLRQQFERPLLLLQWLVGAVLLIGATNVAGLQLARGAARQRELAIRGAIGAGRGRLVSQLVAESVVLAVLGGVAGLALGFALTRALLKALPYDPSNFTLSVMPDLNVLLFTLGISAVTVLVFGLLPAWQNSRVSPASTMREQGGSVTGSSASLRMRKLFVGVQVALSVLLLLGAGLFIRTLTNLRQIDLGLRPEGVVVFAASLATPYEPPLKIALYRSLMERLNGIAGVKAAGANVQQLFAGGRSDGSITLANVAENREPNSFFNWVTPGYFEALGIPVKAGRDFTWRDWGAGKRLALINEQIGRDYFESTPAVGAMIGRGARVPLDTEIIGVFGDAHYHQVRGSTPRQVFFNADSRMINISSMNVYVRVSGDPYQAMPAIRAEVARLDQNLVVGRMRTLEDQIDSRVVNERLLSYLSGAFAVLATLLAVVGLYGVLAFTVSRRTKEIGIRIALGAKEFGVVRLVTSDMLTVVVIGIGIGLAAGYYCGKYVETMLFGVKASDPMVFVGASGVLLVAAVIAAWVPAWRASRLDPLRALRHE